MFVRKLFQRNQKVGTAYMFFTKTNGIGGRIRQRIEDFEVEEIPKSMAQQLLTNSPDNEYTVFWLEKFNWDTNAAIIALARALHVSKTRFGMAGTKDKRAVTRQQISAWKVPAEELKRINIKGLRLYGYKTSNKRLTLGDLAGNRFIVTIRDISLPKDEVEKRIDNINNELKKGIPNIFGPQRFGDVRPITAEVGRAILKCNLEIAVKLYLTRVFDKEPEDVRNVRQYLASHWKDKKARVEALKIFPRRLKWERSILGYLIQYPNDYGGALRRLPKRLRKMFINAVQAEIWNNAVKELLAKGIKRATLPLVGYDTVLDNDIKMIFEAELDKMGITQESFKVPCMPELATTGSERAMMLQVNDLKILEITDDELNPGKLKVKISFSLPAGSYASIVLKEIMKSELP